ncbi:MULTISPECIES: cytochrome o ubiquinol oxidase subunit III [unclassified Neochlamydia]|uniref:cytochrome o ubiquinol oxidase subunit III n=1 Tax=unclassified Neochlamydia TaxID=2643326 RepID=UPI001BC9AC2C|nr:MULTISPECIES: cytochrome o ubiquinol oxidase subunit III [unclassified Neochlamydia]MBS4165248.1 Cytochrome bo(3) ubiquinol oxidase subunit 3 [Neochlamydia sp. AcF65]MBS4170947.1 Cytochrome bo(3) ubiquinol oxidase subunit 3 [Neochlamydia sp. AcF95]
MTDLTTLSSINHADSSQATSAKTLFGFWIYLMTDCILFATFFATYAVLHNSTYGGPSAGQLFSPTFALIETLILLTSSFTSGLVMLAAHRQEKNKTLSYLSLTFLLGLSFLILEIMEFNYLIQEGHSWQKSAFLSAYFTLVSTHGLHILAGLLWIVVLGMQILSRGLSANTLRRLACFSMFWHFLDIIWIFIFTFVYLMGAQ